MRITDPDTLCQLLTAMMERGEPATVTLATDDNQVTYAEVVVNPTDVTAFSYWLAQLGLDLRLQAYADKMVVAE